MTTGQWQHGNGNMAVKPWRYKHGNGHVGMAKRHIATIAQSIEYNIAYRIAYSMTKNDI